MASARNRTRIGPGLRRAVAPRGRYDSQWTPGRVPAPGAPPLDCQRSRADTKIRVFESPEVGRAVRRRGALVAGCGKKDDPIAQAEKTDVAKGVAAPGIAETKAIAEEAFIYGLPLVMNYAVMNEFVVDKNSGQYKAPFNTINNEARVFTYKDTAVVTPNSDTPYSMLWLDLRAEPMVISVPAVREGALLLGAAHRRQCLQLRLHRQPRDGQRGRRLPRRRSRLERRDARRASRRSSSRRRPSRSPFSAPSSSTPPTCRTW